MAEDRKLFLATWNEDKIREIHISLRGLAWDLVGASERPGLISPEETGQTLEENAVLKARYAHEHTGLISLADDTGLEVDALGGAPGVRSHRFAGENVTYEENVNHLLRKMENISAQHRKARFRTAMALGPWKGRYHTVEGVLDGEITTEPLGDGGFGYDPVFKVASLGKTLAQLSIEEKNSISHRGLALAASREVLANWNQA